MRIMIWNLHDWSASREVSTQAQPALLRLLLDSRADIVFLNEVRNLDDLNRIVGGYFHVSATPKLVYMPNDMLENHSMSFAKAWSSGARPFFEHYALLIRRDIGVSCDSGGFVSLAPRDEGRRSSRLRGSYLEPFTYERLPGEEVLLCRMYRPAWHWTCYSSHNQYAALEILGVHTKPVGSKTYEGLISTMGQTCQAVRHASDNFVSGYWVVGGDFYAAPDRLRAELGQAVDARVFGPNENTNHPHSGEGGVADYFVVGSAVNVPRHAVRIDITNMPSSTKQYSDHDPVWIDVAWP